MVCKRCQFRCLEHGHEYESMCCCAFALLPTFYNTSILKRYLFHLGPYLKQSTLSPGNFLQIESELTENGFLLEINTSLRGI